MENSSDYTLGTNELVTRYEGMVKSHTPIYFDSQEFIKIYEFYLAHERFKEADIAITTAWKLYPTDQEIVLYYSDELVDQGKAEEAYHALRNEGIELTEDIYLQRGEILLKLGKIKQAEEEFDKAAEEAGYDIEILIDILTTYTKNIYVEKGAKYLKIIEEKFPIQRLLEENRGLRDSLASYYMLTRQHQKNYEIALIETELEPYSYSAWGNLASALIINKEYSEANEAIDFALAIEPENEDLLTTKFNILLQLGNKHQIAGYLQRRVKDCRDSIRPSLAFINYYIQEELYYDAYTYGIYVLNHNNLDKLDLGEEKNRERDENRLELLIKISEAAILDKKERLGHQYALLAMYENHHSDQPYSHYGWCWLSLKKPNAAIANSYFKLALKHTTPENRVYTLLTIGDALFEKKAYSEAIVIFEEVIKEDSLMGIGTYPYLVYAYYITGDQQKTMNYLKKMSKEMPLMFLKLDDLIPAIDQHKLSGEILALKQGFSTEEN